MSKSSFAGARSVAYLDSAAEGLPPDSCEEALRAYARDKSRGTPGRRQFYQVEQEVRCAAARLLGAAADNVALLSNSSDALNLLANSIDWRPGDEVLITDLEFPSNVLAWLRLRPLGVRVVVVPSQAGIVRLEDFLSRIGPSTRIVSVSQVSYKTGTQIPFLDQLSRHARDAGAWFCLDATQALGRVPVSAQSADYLVASSYKWLLGPHGLAVVYLSPQLQERMQLGAAGWYSAENIFTPDRFEAFSYKSGASRLVSGMPNFPALYALKEGIGCILNVGVERIHRELRPLMRSLYDGLDALGLRLLTPPGDEYASGIVSFAHPRAEEIGAALEREGVIVWAGDGRVRISAHLYNDASDIARCLEALGRI